MNAALDSSLDELTSRIEHGIVSPLFSALPAPWNDPTKPARIVERNRRETARHRVLDALVSRGVAEVPGELRDELSTLVTEWASAGFNPAFEKFAAFEERCEAERDLLLARASGDQARVLVEMEIAHCARVIDEYGSVDIRGLQMSARVLQSLDVVYVPLHIEDPTQPEEMEVPVHTRADKPASERPPATKQKKPRKGRDAQPSPAPPPPARSVERIKYLPRRDALSVIERHARLLILGNPGAGKSTLLSYAAVRLARGVPEGDVRWVPFVVPVRSLPDGRLDLDAVAALSGCDRTLLDHVIEERRAWFLIDGLDEAQRGVPDGVSALLAFVEATPDARFTVTSRPSAAGLDPREVSPTSPLTERAGFVESNLLPMLRDEAQEFVRRWCRAAELHLQRDPQSAEATARAAADDLLARVRSSPSIERLAETPLMCSVLCVVHRFLGNRIPERRVALYEACTNVLLYDWDRAKFQDGAVIGRLDAQQKRHLLSGLARAMHERHVAELPAATVLDHFRKRLPDVGHAADDAPKVLAEIRDRSGVLVERRRDVYGFSHLMFQEYLAAHEYVARGDYLGLVKHAKEEWWREVIALTAGIPGVDAETLVEKLLLASKRHQKDGSDKIFYVPALTALECAATATALSAVSREVVDMFANLWFLPSDAQSTVTLARLNPGASATLMPYFEKATRQKKACLFTLFAMQGYEPSFSLALRHLKDDALVEKAAPILARLDGSYLMELDAHPLSFWASRLVQRLVWQTPTLVDGALSALPTANMQALWQFSDGFPCPRTPELDSLMYRSDQLIHERVTASPPRVEQAPAPRTD